MTAAPDRCAERMGRREADSRGAMNISNHSELGCLQEAASSDHQAGEEPPSMGCQRAAHTRSKPEMEVVARAQTTTAEPMEVKKHQHKHNLKHRYEVMETLGKGTYGKVKKAVEKTSLRTVSVCKQHANVKRKNTLFVNIAGAKSECSV